jgi:hypothetical protein
MLNIFLIRYSHREISISWAVHGQESNIDVVHLGEWPCQVIQTPTSTLHCLPQLDTRRHPTSFLSIMHHNDDDFLQSLLSQMNSDDASRTSKSQPKETKPPAQQPKAPQHPSPSKEMKNLLEGAEDWDWSVDFDEPSIEQPAIPVSPTRQTPLTTRLLISLKMERLPERVNAPDHSQRRVLGPHTRCIVKGVEGPTSARRDKVFLQSVFSCLHRSRVSRF